MRSAIYDAEWKTRNRINTRNSEIEKILWQISRTLCGGVKLKRQTYVFCLLTGFFFVRGRIFRNFKMYFRRAT